MPKVNVSFSREVLDKIDRAAGKRKSTRSAFLAEAAVRLAEETDEEEIHRKQLAAAKAIDRFREEFGNWDGTAEVLKWRDLH